MIWENLSFFFLVWVLCQISITFILWENMPSMCAEFRRAANLTMSWLIKQEVDNYADTLNCSWYQVSFRVFIALDLRALYVLLLTDSSAWEVTDSVKWFLGSRSIGATAANRLNLRGESPSVLRGFACLLVTISIPGNSSHQAHHMAIVANRTLPGWTEIITVTSCVSITYRIFKQQQ